METDVMIGLTLVIVLGIAAQWLAWRIKVPAILVLLIVGFVVGPISDAAFGEAWLAPDKLLGPLLFPFVSLAVAVILFEGGLSLKLSELRQIGRGLRGLITVGVVVTWAGATTAAHYLIGMDWPLATLLGAILVVTGPTVIGPLLRQVRPGPQVGSLLKWEGMLNDPLGAILAVLVFESIAAHAGAGVERATLDILVAIALALLCGLGISALAAGLVILPLRRFWVPDFLQSPVTLAIAVLAFALSNLVQHESGLLTVTVMGMILANQRWVTVRHIIEFKENLRVLLIASLFILLAARLDATAIGRINGWSLAFLAVIMFVVRPVAVALSTIGSELNWRQRLWVGLVAPRGIVAAAVSSIFALSLTGANYTGAGDLMPHTFLVIIGTIVFCGVFAGPMARWLGLSAGELRGLLIMGAHPWAREIAATLRKEGFEPILVDTNRTNVAAARLAGLPARHGSLLAEDVQASIDFTGIRSLLAMTPNDEANTLAADTLAEDLDRKEVFQLVGVEAKPGSERKTPSSHRGRELFAKEATFESLSRRFENGRIKVTRLTDTFDMDAFRRRYGERALPLFLIGEQGEFMPMTVNDTRKPQPGHRLVSVIDNEALDSTEPPTSS